MPAVTYKGALSQGEPTWTATGLNTKIQCTKSYVAEGVIGTVGDQFDPHTKGATTHAGVLRQISLGASKTFFEGNAAARIGDTLSDGDKIVDGSAKTFVE
jgi:uncharacterized Zn-binding protein involved in type VI secretion